MRKQVKGTFVYHRKRIYYNIFLQEINRLIVMVFNVTFNNISVISVLLVDGVVENTLQL
jgi:type III secretory pathway lipoprotein EscJ